VGETRKASCNNASSEANPGLLESILDASLQTIFRFEVEHGSIRSRGVAGPMVGRAFGLDRDGIGVRF
jgi:hypothetical protein